MSDLKMATKRNPNTIFNVNRRLVRYPVLSTTAFAVFLLFVTSSHAQYVLPTATYNFKSSEQDSVHVSTVHHYQSAAQEANDALLITEVKKALADSGVAAHRAIVVDCDHGTISLDGVVGSATDARRAAAVTRDVDGVVAVRNNLKWP
jgi:osmotically-inducible protein OsmY